MNNLIHHNLQNNDDENGNICNNLSEMEKQVLFLAALNKSNKQISLINESLGIRKTDYNTIKALMSQRIYKKLNVGSLDKAVVRAIETKQLDKIPESLLNYLLKDFYLIETKKDCISI
ncbi:MAG: hypothetical protein PHC75_05065 [Burkholderiales bacterium]|nr:hypothetical protein [Burkholderiales bacterium]